MHYSGYYDAQNGWIYRIKRIAWERHYDTGFASGCKGGDYGQFMAMKHPMISLYPSREEDEASVEWTVCGSLCTINDLLVKKMPFADLKIGDVLVFENTGAYYMTEGIALFLTRDLPEVVLLLEDGRMQVVRERFQTDVLNCPVYEL